MVLYLSPAMRPTISSTPPGSLIWNDSVGHADAVFMGMLASSHEMVSVALLTTLAVGFSSASLNAVFTTPDV
eukprot:12763895-Ditylum_brightwellii.AAC.1